MVLFVAICPDLDYWELVGGARTDGKKNVRYYNAEKLASEVCVQSFSLSILPFLCF